jgi:hypothetical protein
MKLFPSFLLITWLILLLPAPSLSNLKSISHKTEDRLHRVLDEVQSYAETFKKALDRLFSSKSTKVLPLFPLKPKDGKVNVVTYTSFNYSQTNLSVEYHLTRDIWVSSVEEIQPLCQKWESRGHKLKMRLLQLLGLRPESKMTHFVIFSVPIDRIYRPSPNPDPTSIYPCGHELTSDCQELLAMRNLTEQQQTIASWLNETLKVGPRSTGYPWTGLGYTYDWSPDSRDNYGVSEYIVMAHTNVTIQKIISEEEFCTHPLQYSLIEK